ncbi:hypothetical protein BS50DRAFT_632479 [Corynespora cassiicola Philippines]|uniref:DUF8021 domain-containing protein n=1 Tax=Corynespora cassiicola Philippines TaxID=1448308 RepID=A0A2T2NT28_CORCC|nr:hypothetical protein BS50DRAFT_632479 [Corynespora cassiicola Philippines]
MRCPLLLYFSLAAQASAACTRSGLQETVARYIQAQTSGQLDLLPLAPGVSYTENDAPTDMAKGVLSQPVTIDFHRSLYDTAQCAAFTELAAATGSHPYVIHSHIFVVDDSITNIQSVVSDAGDWLFNATAFLSWTKREKWDTIAEGKRDSRAVIKAAGDAYLDSWGNGSVRVPYGTPCARLEGGAYTGERNQSSNTCRMPEFPQPFRITNRRYIIDEEMGGMDIFNDFPFIDATKPNGTASSNFMRIEGGMLRYIHEVTVCATRNCGR